MKRVVEDSKRVKDLKHKARRRSIKEGIFSSGKTSFGDYYISPFAIAVNASNSVVSLISSVSGLIGPLSQIFGSRLIEKFPRKKIVLRAVLIESFLWIPFVILSLLFYNGIITNLIPILLLIFFSIYTAVLSVGHPAWFSWVGDLVDESYRGRWFSKRNLIIGATTVLLTISASIFLDFMSKNNLSMIGFSILFGLAFLSRIQSYNVLSKQYEPKLRLKKGDYFSFSAFILRAPKTNFGRFTLFRFTYSIASYISSPLITIYLLRNLQFDYLTYMIIIMSVTIFSVLSMEVWGKFADRYGNYRTLIISSIMTVTLPLLWIISPSVVFLIFVAGLITGIANAGFNLSSGNFIYDNVSHEKRGLAISYFNMLDGLGIFIGAGIAAILIKYLQTPIQPIIVIFIIGFIARSLVVSLWINHMHESRKTETFDSRKALNSLILQEGKPTLVEEVHDLMSIKKYLREK